MAFKFQLGLRVRDIVTGFEGIITGRAEYLNGCRSYCVKPPLDKDGKLQSAAWLDEEQLDEIGVGVHVVAEPSGGPREHDPSSGYDEKP